VELVKTFVVLASLLSVAVLPATVRAQEPEKRATPDQRAQARAFFEEGQRKYDVAKFDEAAANWIKAYELVGDPVILFNIAQAYRLGGEHQKAILFYRNYLRRVDVDPKQRALVEQRLAELNHAVEQSKHVTEAPPQEALKPKPPLGSSETASTTPPPPTQPKPEEAKPTPPPTPTETPTQPTEAQKPPEQPTTTAAPEARARTFRYAGFGVLGVAAASFGVAGAMSGLAAAYSQDVSAAATNRATFDDTLKSKDDNGPIFQNVGITFWVVGGLATAAATTLLYLGYRHPREKTLSLAPVIAPRTGGFMLEARY
jgi:hypothetical protein